MSNEERETLSSNKEVGEVTITEYRKNQIMRLGECFIVSPILIYSGIKYRKQMPVWVSATLIGAGVVTLGYNAYNFYQNWNRDGKLIREAIKKKREEESKIREKIKKTESEKTETPPVSSETIAVPEKKEVVADIPIGIGKESNGHTKSENPAGIEVEIQPPVEEKVEAKIKFDMTETNFPADQHAEFVEQAIVPQKSEPPQQIVPELKTIVEPAIAQQVQPQSIVPIPQAQHQHILKPVQPKPIPETKIVSEQVSSIVMQTPQIVAPVPKKTRTQLSIEPTPLKTEEIKKSESDGDGKRKVKKDTKPMETEVLKVTKNEEQVAETKEKVPAKIDSASAEKIKRLKELKNTLGKKEKFDGDIELKN